jgi:creatinine amidohydrolase
MELARLGWPDAREAIRRVHVALLAVGAMEQHGPHLPLASDLYIASRIAEEVAERDGLLLLPAVPVGVSREHRQFWGTLSLSPDQLRDHAISIARSLGDHGLRRVVFVNGHGSNCAPLDAATRSLADAGVHAFVFNWWQSIAPTLAELFPDPTAHAGSIETSLMLAIRPELVRTDRFPATRNTGHWGSFVEGVQVGFDAAEFSEEGNVGEPGLADVEKGRTVLSAACDSLSRFCAWLAARTEDELAPRPHLS